jgi:hypothetical protein
MNQMLTLEQNIVSLLKAAMPSVTIAVMPSGDDAVLVSKMPRGGFYVQYQGSRFTKPNGLGGQNQIRDVKLSVILLYPDANKHSDAYTLLDNARQALQGANVGAMYPLAVEEERFIDAQSGWWKYAISVSTSLMTFAPEPAPNPFTISLTPTITGL